MRTSATVVLLAAIALAFGSYRLAEAPGFIDHAEVDIALEARSLAGTGRSTSGERLPLFVPTPAYPAGREPLSLYGTTFLFSVLPFSTWTLRLGSVIVYAIDVAMMYLVARAIFAHEGAAIAAAILLLASPAHLTYGRLATNAIYPIPFVLAWLWCTARYLERPRTTLACAAGLSLGIGVYSYPSALVMMPILLAATVAVIVYRRGPWPRAAVLALLGFALPLAGWALWSWMHFDRLSALASHYKIYDASQLNLLQGLRDVTSYFGLSVRSYLYWQYFSPSVLFFAGEPVVLNSARHVGLLPLPAALIFAAGLYRVTTRRAPTDLLVILGMVASPLAAALESSFTARRALVMLPFAVLIAAAGVQFACARVKGRYLAGLLLAVSLVQFQVFYARYLTEPRMQSVSLFEEDVRGAFDEVMRRLSAGPVPAIVLSADIPVIGRHWELYLVMRKRSDLLARTRVLSPDEIDASSLPSGSLIVRRVSDRWMVWLQRLAVIERP